MGNCWRQTVASLFVLLQLVTVASSSSASLDKQWSNYHDQEQLEQLLFHINKRCPNFTTLYTIGKSVQGRELVVIQFSSTPGVHETLKPEVKYVGNMHGNEPVGRELMLRLATYLCDQLLAKNKEVMKMIESVSLHLLPTMNPDGFEFAFAAGSERRGWSTGRSNANGVDLNRDFPDLDGFYYYLEDHNIQRFDHLLELFDAGQKVYQPETRAVGEWILSMPFVLSANLHEGDMVANYPFDSSRFSNTNVYAKSPDDLTFRYLAESYASKHPYMAKPDHAPCDGTMDDAFGQRGGITNGAQWYSVSGGMQDFNYLASNAFEITLELYCDKFPAASLLPKFWNDNQNALMSFIKKAHLGIKGTVRNSFTESPIENAVIWIKNSTEDTPIKHPVTTWKSGEYFRLLTPGSYTVYAVANGYETMSKRVNVTNDNEFSAKILNFELNPDQTEQSIDDQQQPNTDIERLEKMLDQLQ